MGAKRKNKAMAVTAKQIGFCLKHLQDGTTLRQSSLIKLPTVCRLAAEKYAGSYWGRSYALRDVLLEVCAHLATNTADDPGVKRLVTLITLYSNDTPIAHIARTLGVSNPLVATTTGALDALG